MSPANPTPPTARKAKSTWDLSQIYASPADWEADFHRAEAGLPELGALQGALGGSGAALLRALEQRDALFVLVDRLHMSAHLQADLDRRDSASQARAERADRLMARFHEAAAFIKPEIVALDEAQLAAFYAGQPGLETYRFHIDEARRLRPHARSPEVEALLAQAGEVLQTPGTIYEALNEADLHFPEIADPGTGEALAVTHASIWGLLENRNREIRRAALQAYVSVYVAHRNSFAAALAGAVARDNFLAGARGYASAVEAALDAEGIPQAVYDALLHTVRAHAPLLRRYMQLIRRALDVEQLYIYDLSATLTPGVEATVSYEEACARALAALGVLGAEYTAVLEQALYEQGWVDAFERPHKRSGGYNWCSYTTHPFILLNWQGTLWSQSILAHELGHAMHSWYSQKNQPGVYSECTLFVAEVASNVNEQLLFDHLLDTTTDPQQRLLLLEKRLGQLYGALFIQTMFAEFELEAHRRKQAGEALTADALDETAHNIHLAYFGSEVSSEMADPFFWEIVPHFQWNFYVYKYATGISAALAVARAIRQQGQPAVARWLAFLEAGSSRPSLELLREAGVDLTTPQPFEDALRTFSELLEQYEADLAA
ncbi:MAG: oligoendopeptidase F [Chloroflexota bacterium]